MNGGGGDAPPGASGGEFLLSLLQKQHHQQRQPQPQPTQQQTQQTLSLDPAVAAVGPTVPLLPPWSSNGRDFPSHPWPHNNSPPLPPHYLGLPQNHWLPGNQTISGEDLQRLGFPVINSNRTVHNPVQQEPKKLVFGSFNNSATPKQREAVGLGNGFDRNQNRRFTSNSNSNSNSNPNYGVSDSREKEWRGKQHSIGNYRSTPSQETRRGPPPPGFSRGGNWDYGNRRKGIDHNVDKEKVIYNDEDVSNVKLRVNRMVDHPGPAARSIVHSALALDVEESVKDLQIDDADNEDDFGHQLVDSLLDESHDKKDKKQHRNFDKEARSDDRGRRLLSQRIRMLKWQMECRNDIDRLKAPFLAIYESLVPPEEEKAKQKQLITLLEELVTKEWPKARLFLYGSCANSFGIAKFGVSKSDIDVCLAIEDADIEKSEVLSKLADIFQSNDLQDVQVLARARVPIVKLMDQKTGISCDICINNILAVVNTKLLWDYAQIDVRLRQLAFIVKHWAKSRGVNETYRGTLSSYAYVLMCIHFLQLRRPAILPCLQEMETTYSVTVENIECAYYDQVENLRNFGSHNKETIAHLVWAFFNYWAYRHDYANDVISIRTGSIISKREKDWTRRIGNDRHLICIEDPFEISHDLGRVVDKYSIKVLREEFERAADIMQYSPNPCVTLFEPYVPLPS